MTHLMLSIPSPTSPPTGPTSALPGAIEPFAYAKKSPFKVITSKPRKSSEGEDPSLENDAKPQNAPDSGKMSLAGLLRPPNSPIPSNRSEAATEEGAMNCDRRPVILDDLSHNKKKIGKAKTPKFQDPVESVVPAFLGYEQPERKVAGFQGLRLAGIMTSSFLIV